MPLSSHFPNGIIFVADHPFSAASVTEAPASRPAADDGRDSYDFRKESDYAFALVRSSLQRDELQQTLEVEAEPIELSADLAFPLGLITAELVGNALRHAFERSGTGMVWVQFGRM